jgi:hypothetical protein
MCDGRGLPTTRAWGDWAVSRRGLPDEGYDCVRRRAPKGGGGEEGEQSKLLAATTACEEGCKRRDAR